MRVALVTAISEYACYEAPGDQVDPPLGLLHLATAIKKQHCVRIFDGQLQTCTPHHMARDVLAWKPDVVGFSVNFSTVARSSRIMAECIKQEAPGTIIVLGGNYATFHRENLIPLPYVDFILMHEAEQSFPHLLDYMEGRCRSLPPGSVRQTSAAGEVEIVPFDRYNEDLDSLPFCDYTLFDDPSRYVKAIISSRGCPYTCIYCATQEMWKRWRSRSAANVVAEMMTLGDVYGPKQILFSDDIFIVNKRRTLDICDLLTAEGSPVLWGFSTRLETIREDMIPTLARAGVRWIFFGVESGSNRVLEKMDRRYTRDEALRKIKVCADNGITCTASFIIGLPWETEEDVSQTFNLMAKVATHRVLLNIFTPLSGTLSLSNPETYGIEFTEPFDPERAVVGHGYVNYRTAHLTKERIKSLWLIGQGIVVGKGRRKATVEAEIQRNRYGLMGLSNDLAIATNQQESKQPIHFGTPC